MQLDLTVIKNETSLKFAKVLIQVRNKFAKDLSLVLDTSHLNLDQEKREEVEIKVSDMFHDELTRHQSQFTGALNKICNTVVDGLA
jgi:hypothetical protein